MKKRLGVYFHIPFCASNAATAISIRLPDMTTSCPNIKSALLSHINESSAQMSEYYIDSVYFGGGTPAITGQREYASFSTH